MDFALSPEQAELSATLRALLDRRSDSAAVRAAAASEPGYDAVLWGTLCSQIGAAALAVPEEYGGAGFSLFETHLVLEQLGRSLAPSPMLGSAVLAAQAVLRSGDTAACERLLPAIAEGRVAALAWADEHGRWRTDGSSVTASEGVDGWRLTGTSTLVLDGATADVLLVVATTPHGVGVFEVEPSGPGVRRTRTPALDPTLSFATVALDDAAGRPLTTDAGTVLADLHDVAAVAVSALQVGVAQRGLDMTVAYSKERVQFGRPVGSFQALKHRMADMLVDVETTRSASWAAAWSAAQGDDDLPRLAAVAKAWGSDAATRVAAETVQLHGGVAITWEHDAHLVFKRAHALAELFGPARAHRSRLAELTWRTAG